MAIESRPGSTPDRHDHLHCQVCNRLIEFQSSDLERIRDQVAKQHEFQVVGHRLFVTGICSECRKRQKRGIW